TARRPSTAQHSTCRDDCACPDAFHSASISVPRRPFPAPSAFVRSQFIRGRQPGHTPNPMEDPDMRIVLTAAIVGAALLGVAHAPQPQQMQQAQIDWSKVDDAFGRKPAATGGDVHRYGFPRSDLQVTLDGVAIKPSLALGSWVAMKPAHGGVMAMG